MSKTFRNSSYRKHNRMNRNSHNFSTIERMAKIQGLRGELTIFDYSKGSVTTGPKGFVAKGF